MDAARFDRLVLTLVSRRARRRAVLVFPFGSLPLAFWWGGVTAGPGCENVSKKCKKASDCCSGICKGKKGKKRCKGHDGGGCTAGQDACAVSSDCTTSAGLDGHCATTTGEAAYCTFGTPLCSDCTRDPDCQDAIFGPHAACLTCTTCPLGTACGTPLIIP